MLLTWMGNQNVYTGVGWVIESKLDFYVTKATKVSSKLVD